MNIVLYYGGFFLAIFAFILAVLFFIAFNIPATISYFKKYSKKGLVQSEASEKIPEEAMNTASGRHTEVMTAVDGTRYLDPQLTMQLRNMPDDVTELLSTMEIINAIESLDDSDGREDFDKTELLPRI